MSAQTSEVMKQAIMNEFRYDALIEQMIFFPLMVYWQAGITRYFFEYIHLDIFDSHVYYGKIRRLNIQI